VASKHTTWPLWICVAVLLHACGASPTDDAAETNAHGGGVAGAAGDASGAAGAGTTNAGGASGAPTAGGIGGAGSSGGGNGKAGGGVMMGFGHGGSTFAGAHGVSGNGGAPPGDGPIGEGGAPSDGQGGVGGSGAGGCVGGAPNGLGVGGSSAPFGAGGVSDSLGVGGNGTGGALLCYDACLPIACMKGCCAEDGACGVMFPVQQAMLCPNQAACAHIYSCGSNLCQACAFAAWEGCCSDGSCPTLMETGFGREDTYAYLCPMEENGKGGAPAVPQHGPTAWGW
jgi:hypothetical protein